MKTIKFFLSLSLSLFLLGASLGQQKPEETEVWEPEPPVVTPSTDHTAPSDAIALFDGKDFSKWTNKDGGKVQWKIGDDAMTVVKGTGLIKSKQGFGSVQLHIEWRTPAEVVGESQGRGNSGIFLQGLYEVQVLDSYNNRTYSNGQAASIYKQHIPLVNACRGPGEWQTYDIIYQAPEFTDGKLVQPAYVTVIQNGVLVQNHVELKGPTVYIGAPKYESHEDKLPITLQDHGNPVSYRNIWVREL